MADVTLPSLIERLRGWYPQESICMCTSTMQQAADEIERLERELAEEREHHAITVTEYRGVQRERDEARANAKQADEATTKMHASWAPLVAERDRLYGKVAAQDLVATRQADEISRLRAALERIAGRICSCRAHDIAREALEGK